MLLRKKKMSYERKKSIMGYWFIAPWLFGSIYFFIIPLIQSFIYSLSNVSITPEGPKVEFIGLGHYRYALLENPDFTRTLFGSVGSMLYQAPLVIIFSIFIATILNQNFKGRTLMRAVFFLPVIIATGPVIGIINGDTFAQQLASGDRVSNLFEVDFVTAFVSYLGLDSGGIQLAEIISTVVNEIFALVWRSGIQILIFLAALQTIPRSAREAASMEGATSWEYFWKIIFPQISPMILANLIYTIIDNFTDNDNAVMRMVLTRVREVNYDTSAAIAWIYFVVVLGCIGIIVALLNKYVYYEVE